jgi:hypothetical protein
MATEYESEYGGVSNVIQPAAKGHVDLTAKERRFINASYRRRTAGVDFSLPETDLHRPYVDEVLADFDNSKGTGRTAGRTPDEAVGENVS